MVGLCWQCATCVAECCVCVSPHTLRHEQANGYADTAHALCPAAGLAGTWHCHNTARLCAFVLLPGAHLFPSSCVALKYSAYVLPHSPQFFLLCCCCCARAAAAAGSCTFWGGLVAGHDWMLRTSCYRSAALPAPACCICRLWRWSDFKILTVCLAGGGRATNSSPAVGDCTQITAQNTVCVDTASGCSDSGQIHSDMA